MFLDILNFVTIKLEGLQSKNTNYIVHEYGDFVVNKPSKDPDIVIKFIKDKTSAGRHIHVRPPVAYDDKGVFLFDPDYRLVRVDFATLGLKCCTITCDVAFNPHFFAIILEYVIHFNLLKKDATYCHSSALVFNNKTLLFPAWRNVGKTNLLLSFLQDKAEYLGDDWSILDKNGLLYSLPKRLNLLYYNFEAHPELLDKTDTKFNALVDFVKRAKKGEYDLNEDVIELLTNQARMRISSYDLFNQKPDFSPRKIDYVFLLQRSVNTETDSFNITPLSKDKLVNSLSSILDFEQSYFHLAYTVYKAQTGCSNELIEKSKETTKDILFNSFSRNTSLFKIELTSQSITKDIYKEISKMLLLGE